MRKRLVTGFGAVLLAAAVIAGGAATPATAAPATPGVLATGLNATIALNNCSASLVRYPDSVDSDRALMLTNGHCYEGGMPGAGVVLQNKTSTRSGTLLNDAGTGLGTVRADKLIYATMTNTDVALYQLNTTFASIKTSFGVTAMTIAPTHPVSGIAITIPSGYWKTTYNCGITGYVPTLREDAWTWHDSIKYTEPCATIGGTSGSPILDSARNVIGVNNTGNEDGAMCTLNNPCEVDPDGTTHAYRDQSYGQQTYWFTTCLTSARVLDLTVPGCLLTGASTPGNTVTVTNPGNQTSTVNVADSVQIQASSSGSGQTLTYSATGLPAGLTINASTGLISGTPTATGTSNVTVTAKDTTNATGTTSFTWTVSGTGGCTAAQVIGNSGFEATTATPWTASTGVIRAGTTTQPAHGGTKLALLGGKGSTNTTSVSQSVAVPAGCSTYTLSYWLHIDTKETTTSTQYDKLTVKVGSTTLASYSNLNKATGYSQKTFNLSAYAGQTVTLTFTGTEDSSLVTNFVIDDVTLNVS
ncbi:putative Ig domain-containing protein [Longispora urticae]